MAADSNSLRCCWCQSTEFERATVVGAQPHEHWFRCIYCRCFFSTRQNVDPQIATRTVPAWPRRLIVH